MHRSLMGRLSLTALVLAAMGFAATVVAQQAGSTPVSLQGSWMVATVPADGSPRAKALFTFHAHGGLIENDTASMFVPVGHGVWTQTGDRQFATTFVQFVSNSGGDLDNTVKVRETVTVDDTGNNYTARFKSVVTDTKGKVVYTGTGTETGTRIRVEPL